MLQGHAGGSSPSRTKAREGTATVPVAYPPKRVAPEAAFDTILDRFACLAPALPPFATVAGASLGRLHRLGNVPYYPSALGRIIKALLVVPSSSWESQLVCVCRGVCALPLALPAGGSPWRATAHRFPLHRTCVETKLDFFQQHFSMVAYTRPTECQGAAAVALLVRVLEAGLARPLQSRDVPTRRKSATGDQQSPISDL